ncbi:hypothetical protein [Lewinella sp. IMCC34183]|uniref:hypothetical protein n=1 Tax=Lewinella sp. IMCC34183 TaxID=2248762 RepID=UPI000E233FEA|nr:hypothetical protein [Lewinella sp. IMCC34183]
MRFRLFLMFAVLLAFAVRPLYAQADPPNIYPGSFTAQLNVGVVWASGLKDVAYANPYGGGLDIAVELQRRIPIGEQVAVRAGVGYALYNVGQRSDAGTVACRLIGQDCMIPPQPLNVEMTMQYLSLPTDLEIRFRAPADKLYGVVHHTLLINLNASVSGAEVGRDSGGNEVSRYPGELRARSLVSIVGIGLGLRSSRDARRPAYLELGPVFSLGKLNEPLPELTPPFRTNYARPAGVAGVELRMGVHF